MTIGYFGIPGRYGGKVHLVDNGQPVCGIKINPKAEYQWCSSWIAERMIECERCKPIVRRILEEIYRRRLAALDGK